MVVQMAKEKNKIAAVSEAGGPIATNTTWWTDIILKTLKPMDITYVLVWRNPWQPASHGAFGPYEGSPDSENFVQFYNDPETLFQKDVTKLNLYK